MPKSIMVNSIGYDDQSLFLIENLNKVQENITVFIREWDRTPKVCKFAVMQEKEAYSCGGTVIATSLQTADLLTKLYRPTKKYFYMWSLEWIGAYVPCDWLAGIYQNDEIKLITRSAEHAQIVERVWGKKALIIEDFNHEELIKL